jgi:uncharacterized protein (DUF1501 family)
MGLTRRATLLGLGAAMTLGDASLALAAVPGERRFVVVLLRGGLDGLAVLVPRGDPDLAPARAPLVPAGLHDLGGFWGLHPALAGVYRLYQAGEVLALPALAGPDRSRSHFAAQDTLERGGPDPGIADGWLNRAARALDAPAVAMGGGVPLLLRGAAPVHSVLPDAPAHPPPDYYAQVLALHRDDALTGPAMAAAVAARRFDGAVLAAAPPATDRGGFPALAAAAGRLLAAADGPRLAALELGGWDTHVRQAPRLAAALPALDAGLLALHDGLGAAWRQTVVLVVTEFGRTVRMNGAAGTDHGTATVALLLGGAVAGGRVAGDWPGLAPARLFEHRDLQPTGDVRALAKGALAAQFGLGAAALAAIFPDSAAAAPLRGLLRG